MTPFVDSLRRLYQAGNPKVTIEKLDGYLAAGTITQDEYDYIVA